MRKEAEETKAAHQQKTMTAMLTVGGKKPGVFLPGVKPPVERGRLRQGLMRQPAGRGLDGFCGATTLTSSGRKMFLAVG